jgi:exopolyphosphatase/guanosine-5'-triphosphate,3'-diphosphate pyrophosphatase
MRVAAIDIGSNSTRLLVADINGGEVVEIERRSVVTRLGDRVDSDGVLSEAGCERVYAVLADYKTQFESFGAERVRGVATSAVRDSANGIEFAQGAHDRLGITIDVIGGDKEAQLTFAGASTGGGFDAPGRALVVDIGGGSTEFIVGDRDSLEFHTSTAIGAVRQSERHLHADPPTAGQITALLGEVGERIRDAVPEEFRGGLERGIAVAGTPTVLASVDQALEVFDPWKVHGYTLTRAACGHLLERLASLPLDERRNVVGLHPDRAPTIVAGAAILTATLDAFGLASVNVSEHDILYGLAREIATQ